MLPRCLLLAVALVISTGGLVTVRGAEPAVAVAADGVALSDPGERNPNALARIWQWSDARVRNIFDYILPDTQERRTWRWSLQPRFGDFLHHDYVRFPMELTYGFNHRTEGTFGLDPYLANPFRDGHGSGIANLNGGLKYRWEPSFDPVARAATGVLVVHPVASAPYDFNDGMNRYSVYTTFSRPNPRWADVEHFVNLSYDLLTPAAAQGKIDEDEPQDDFVKIGTGVLWHNKRLTYGLAIGMSQTVDGVSTTFTTLTPSIVYDVPARYTFHSPGQWQVGTAIDCKRYGDETAFDFKLRVRWDVDFRKVVHEWSEERRRARYTARNDD